MKRAFTFVIMISVIVLGFGGCRSFSRAFNNSGTLFIVDVVPEGNSSADSGERSVNVIRRRLDAVGVDGEVRHAGGNRVEVRVFGTPDIDRLRTFLFKTHKLELRKVVSPPFPQPAKMFPDKEGANASAAPGQLVSPYDEREENGNPQFLILEKDPIITGEDLRSAQAVSRTGDDLDYQISFSLKADGAAKFGEWTERNINNYLAVMLDGKVQSVAFIKSRISDMGEISGRFSKVQAEETALILNSGYMPWELRVVDESKF